jgi:hypothetical protein
MKFVQKIKNTFSEDIIIEKNCVELSNSKKKYIAKLWDGTKIFVVDGEEVRNNNSVAFFGGTHPKYDDCKTKKEIWIEKLKVGQKNQNFWFMKL